ncbi:MAG TPA: DUF4190 domain-containing protein [Pyrinomonadaceae bacterium]|nr:DUF4190 domain-containing protein [Pyrinomonadaceae bacterium]
MKRCPQCGQTYTDNDINFCLNDGELLSRTSAGSGSAFDDPPPTVMMDPPRATGRFEGATTPLSPYQPPGPIFGAPGTGMASFPRTPDQSLPIVAIALGVASLVFVCCYGGIWLGLPAAIVGFLGMRNADKDPERYAGRGLAIAGIVLGIISFILTFMIFIFAVLAPQF